MITNLEGSTNNINNNDQILSVNSEESERSVKINIYSYLSKDQKAYEVLKYNENCEEHNQISYILPLVRSTPKFILFIFLNICTVGIINLVVVWFPKIVLYIYYNVTYLNKATHFGIFSKHDKAFKVIEKKVIDLPPIDYDSDTSVYSKFNFNIEYGATQIVLFEYNLFKYVYSPRTDEFEALNYYIKTTNSMIVDKYSTGLNPNEINYMRNIFGICDLDVKLSSCCKILFNELTDPYYLWILIIVLIFVFTGYLLYGIAIFLVFAIAILIGVLETRKNMKHIEEISRYSCPVKVYRKNENNEVMEGVEIDSTELVPGDVYELPEEGLSLPCDTIIISGSAIINESMLTGESTPVIKVRMIGTNDIYDTTNSSYEKFILFAGTKIIQKRKIGNNKIMGIVFNSGYNTFKGNLIRGILHPKKEKSQFIHDSIKYIIIMSIFSLVGFGVVLKFLIVDHKNSAGEIVYRFFDLFGTAVPASLPACLVIGVSMGISRLKDKKIMCIQRDRLNRSGEINILVFDKTGTLTEDHLDIKGFVTTKINGNKKFEFNKFTESCENYSNTVIEHFKRADKSIKDFNKDLLQYYVECLACCHQLTYVKEKLLGDPIDIQMFESTGWILKENNSADNNNSVNSLILNYIRPKCEEDMVLSFQDNNNLNEKLKNRYEIAIAKRFDFSSKLQRMTVIGKNINEDFFKVFCKGSPEKIKELCDPSTIPESFDETLNNYTTRGYRVLGMAAKSLKMSFKQSQEIKRDIVEKNMIFLGLLIVQNKLKEKTKECLEKFDNADLRMVMATGDNILTAICVSKDCNLIRKNQEMISCSIENVNGIDKLKWEKLEDDRNDDMISIFENRRDLLTNEALINNDTLKINTKTTNTLYDFYPPENINQGENMESAYKKKLKNINQNNFLKDEDNNSVILSRSNSIMSQKSKGSFIPKLMIEEKVPYTLCKDDSFGIAISGPTFERLFLLNDRYMKKKDELFKSAHDAFRLVLKNGRVFARMAPNHKALLVEAFKKEGFMTLMCGDGANDCSALRTAHVSVSLSEGEASIAGHFNSKINDVSCVFELLIEGKCSLSTSMCTFKFMMLYSIIQFFCLILMMVYNTYLNDYQFFFIDILLVFPLEFFLAIQKPSSELTYHYVNSNLFSFPILTSVITHSIIELAFQLGSFYILKHYFPWNHHCGFDEDDWPNSCHANTILFLISLYQFFAIALSFIVTKPFKKDLYTNWPYLIYLAVFYFYFIWLTVNCDTVSRTIFGIYYYEIEDVDWDEIQEISDSLTGGEEEEELVLDIELPSWYDPKADIYDIVYAYMLEFHPMKRGKDMKYYILIIAALNTILNIIFERVIMRFINRCYEERQIRIYKKEIEKAKMLTEGDKENRKIKDVKIFKYQRVYYYNRRKKLNLLDY